MQQGPLPFVALRLFLPFLLIGCFTGADGDGEPSGESFCRSGVDIQCTRFHECADDITKTQFEAFFGTDVASCKSALEASVNCALVATKDQNCAGVCAADANCSTGETCDAEAKRCSSDLVYNLDQAAVCMDAILALSCADFLDATIWPAQCADAQGNSLVCISG